MNLVYEERGRFFGVGVTRPCRRRMRQIVAVDGVDPVLRCRCAAMVSAPAPAS